MLMNAIFLDMIVLETKKGQLFRLIRFSEGFYGLFETQVAPRLIIESPIELKHGMILPKHGITKLSICTIGMS